VVLDAALSARLAAAAASEADGDGAAATAATRLDEDDVAIYVKRVTDLLQPGENVLQALRRLGEIGSATVMFLL
jgi:hypothetical protein